MADVARPVTVHQPIRVMLVEDSVMMRSAIKQLLLADPDIELVATASNGKDAIEQLGKIKADVIVLDIEMPIMDGLTALPKLLKVLPGVQVIISSALTIKGAAISLEALSLGAADYITKPTAATSSADFGADLRTKIKSIGRAALEKRTQKATSKPALQLAPVPRGFRAECLAIGSSTGGPQALPILVQGLGRPQTYPVFITQHMPPTFTAILAEHLAQASGIPAAEGKDGEEVHSGRIYVAPGNHHMLIDVKGGRKFIRLTQDPPENFCRPAVDPMLRSLAHAYKGQVLTLILTGMGRDGTDGMKKMAQAGGMAVAQDEQTSVVWGMPGALAQAGLASAVLPLKELAAHARKFLPGGYS